MTSAILSHSIPTSMCDSRLHGGVLFIEHAARIPIALLKLVREVI